MLNNKKVTHLSFILLAALVSFLLPIVLAVLEGDFVEKEWRVVALVAPPVDHVTLTIPQISPSDQKKQEIDQMFDLGIVDNTFTEYIDTDEEYRAMIGYKPVEKPIETFPPNVKELVQASLAPETTLILQPVQATPTLKTISASQSVLIHQTTNASPHSIKEESGTIINMKTSSTQKSLAPSTAVLPFRPPIAQVTECMTQGQIALTYSEGPSDATAKIARQLNNADARASFFINSTWLGMQQYALVTENLYKDGHLIGMAYRVKNDNSKDMTNEDLKHDIIKNARVIENLIGVAPKYVRLHYTKEKDIRLEKTLAELGFVTVGYNLDSQDYLKKNTTGPDSVPDIYSKTLKNFKEKYNEKGSFISIHYDGPHSSSLDSIGHIVNTIEGEGYMMVRLDGCMNDEKPYKKSSESKEYTFDQFSYKQQNYHQGQKFVNMDPSPNGDNTGSKSAESRGISGRDQSSLFMMLLIAGTSIAFCL
ncbi:hypothetical protein G6F16_006789 [Rhizopus arrhizus]|nr:hypothetical protein G6F21_005304 [Rhizopus arrhizus]KAG0800459.1 hypothetical protein G6F22_002207 [Rhizopus arrhizus]KAG0814505.1 hypothetical protein G6F20_004714 [Rhizopus arrhizus]KAG0832125.1 hypothetical protein G6F19_006386 [Rhizopus arrhizus]KAG0842977.1 hypothetical protein G6F18_002529 [Rhizopus arrhizus]